MHGGLRKDLTAPLTHAISLRLPASLVGQAEAFTDIAGHSGSGAPSMALLDDEHSMLMYLQHVFSSSDRSDYSRKIIGSTERRSGPLALGALLFSLFLQFFFLSCFALPVFSCACLPDSSR